VISLILTESNQNDDFGNEEVSRILNLAVAEGMIEISTNGEYCFLTTFLRHSLANMVSSDQKASFHGCIGRHAFLHYQDKESNFPNSVFIASDHLNQVSLLSDLKTPDMVALNTEAAQHAMSMGAIHSARKYLDCALEWNGGLDWESKYNSTLSVMNMLVNSQFASYQLHDCASTLDLILKNAKSFEDKHTAYGHLLYLRESKWKCQLAIDECFTILNELGVRIPRRKPVFSFALEIMTFKKRIAQLNFTTIVLRKMQGDDLTITAKYLEILSRHALHTQQRNILHFTVMREIHGFLYHGRSESTPSALAHFGTICAWSGDHKGAFYFGELAMKMMDVIDCHSSHAHAYCIICRYSLFRERKLDALISPLNRAFNLSYMNGDIEILLQSYLLIISVSLQSGRHLYELEENARNISQTLAAYESHEISMMICNGVWEDIRYILYFEDEIDIFAGECFQQGHDLEAHIKKGPMIGLIILWFVRLQLACYFKKWDIALELAKKLNDNERFYKGSFLWYFIRIFEALTHVATYRVDRKANKHRKSAKKTIQLLKEKILQGTSWLEPYVMLLEAEEASFHRQKLGLKMLYDAAISAAEIRKLRHIRALASECASAAFLHNDSYLSRQYIANAHEYYYSWGAMGKVKRMEAENDSLEKKPTMVESVTSSRGTRSNSTSRKSKTVVDAKISFQVRKRE
jgi:hypothetical protein